MKKIVRVGTIPKQGSIFCKIEIENGKLSISGVIGPMKNGDALGGCGQICMEFKELDSRGYMSFSDIQLAPAWTLELATKFFQTWERWHLNDMRPGCEHQMAEGWNHKPIDSSKPTTAYGKHFPGQKSDSWNMLAWVRPDEHPEGLLCKPCPVCGYKYGSEWKREELPADVVGFLNSLPETDQTPAWV